jgi:hypothetical protein
LVSAPFKTRETVVLDTLQMFAMSRKVVRDPFVVAPSFLRGFIPAHLNTFSRSNSQGGVCFTFSDKPKNLKMMPNNA